MKHNRGLALIELLILVNILAILSAVGSIFYSEYGDEARLVEIYALFPQIICSQGLSATQYNRYYTASNHAEFRGHGVDLREIQYFSYSTFPDDSSFSIRADAADWAEGGWVLFSMKASRKWNSDDIVIKRQWLPRWIVYSFSLASIMRFLNVSQAQ
ncbi:MAG: hypothetical protein GTN74_02950 [Proteobacteria bacterium]|nr:hypothetical protein [Pseudomonadota bacterium]NIS68128.1 hypothetical protein [Pseudomonadota bacterium]